MVYTIVESGLETVQKKLAPLCKKLDKYGVGYRLQISEPTIAEFQVRIPGGNETRTIKVPVVYIDFEADDIIKVNGYEIVAVLEHTDGAENLVYVTGGKQLQEEELGILRKLPPRCDHCGTNRKRHKTAIVMSMETGKLYQIGLSCLNEYLGIDVADKLEKIEKTMLQALAAFGEWEPSIGAGSFGFLQSYIPLMEILFPIVVGYEEGIIKDNKEELRQLAVEILSRAENGDFLGEVHDVSRNDDVRNKYMETVNNVIEWYRTTQIPESNQFMRNIQVLLQADYVKKNHIYMAVWAYKCYRDVIERQKRYASANPKEADLTRKSAYIPVGTQIKDIKATFDKHLYSGDGDYGSYEVYRLVLPEDKGGHVAVLIWSTSIRVPFEPGQQITIKAARIAENSEYRGCKQNKIKGVKILELIEAQERAKAEAARKGLKTDIAQ